MTVASARHWVAWALFLVAMLALPLVVSKGDLRVAIQAAYLAIFAMSWDFLSGRTGYISFGHPFLIGMGAYASAILNFRFDWPIALSIPAGALIAMVGATLFFLPALRVRGSYFALVTLAFMELMYQLVQVIRPDLTGGTRGMSGLDSMTRGAENNYYFATIVMIAIALALWLLTRTRLGAAQAAIGMDEDAVRGSGLDATRIKLFTFMVSALVAGLGGALFVHYQGSIAPRALFDINFVFTIIVAALIGGAGSIVG
ncbi:MAG: branched-chain amino acid ABC transporter permease, partial [Pseudomonadota bacterium]